MKIKKGQEIRIGQDRGTDKQQAWFLYTGGYIDETYIEQINSLSKHKFLS